MNANWFLVPLLVASLAGCVRPSLDGDAQPNQTGRAPGLGMEGTAATNLTIRGDFGRPIVINATTEPGHFWYVQYRSPDRSCMWEEEGYDRWTFIRLYDRHGFVYEEAIHSNAEPGKMRFRILTEGEGPWVLVGTPDFCASAQNSYADGVASGYRLVPFGYEEVEETLDFTLRAGNVSASATHEFDEYFWLLERNQPRWRPAVVGVGGPESFAGNITLWNGFGNIARWDEIGINGDQRTGGTLTMKFPGPYRVTVEADVIPAQDIAFTYYFLGFALTPEICAVGAEWPRLCQPL